VPHRIFLAADVPDELVPVLQALQAEASALSADEIRKVPEVRDHLRPHLEAAVPAVFSLAFDRSLLQREIGVRCVLES
jgi:hypothetical protein